LLLLPVESEAATTPCISTAFLTATFQVFQHQNIRESRRRHDSTEARAKKFFFCLCIVDLDTIMGFSDKLELQRLSSKEGILLYAKSTHLENTSLWFISY